MGDAIPQHIIDSINGLSPLDYYAYSQVENEHHYIYPLSENRFFYFVRTQAITADNCNELFPITRFLSKAIDAARSYEARLAAEKALVMERRLLTNVLNRLPDAIYLKNSRLEKILTNKADVNNTGFQSASEILGKKIVIFSLKRSLKISKK